MRNLCEMKACVPSARFSDVAAVVTLCVAILAALCRILGIAQDCPVSTMKANIIVGFALASLAFLLMDRGRIYRKVAVVAALLLVALGGVTFAEHVSGVELGVDYLFLAKPFDWSGANHPERMSLLSSFNFVLFGLCVLFYAYRRALKLAQWLSLIVIFTSFQSLVGYLYGTIMHFGLPDHTPMTITSAALFVITGSAAFLHKPHAGMAALAAGHTSGSWVFRSLLPFVILGPILIGWIQLYGENSSYYDSAYRIAVMMGFLSLILVIALWRVALALDKIGSAKLQAEEQLRLSEESYRLLTENSVSAVASHQIVLDAHGVPVDYIFTNANPAFEDQTGLKVSDIIGKRVSEILPDIKKTNLIEIYGKVALSGKPACFDYYVEALGRHYFISAYGLGEGAFATVFNDITERNKAEESLREREAFLNLLVETIPIPVFSKDKDGRYVIVNKAFETLFWMSKDELVGKTVFDVLPLEIAAHAHEEDSKLFQTPGKLAYYDTLVDGMGIHHDVIFQKATLTDKDGRVTGIIGAVLNITDQKRVEEELRDVRFQLDEATARAGVKRNKKKQHESAKATEDE